MTENINFLQTGTPAMNERFQKTAELRGKIINYFSDLEFTIEMIIANFFCENSDRWIEFVHGVVCNTLAMSFDAKREVLTYIIKQKYLDLLPKEMNGEKFFDELKYLMKIRNMAAHLKILTTKENKDWFDGKTVVLQNFEFKSYKTGIKTLTMTDEFVDDYRIRSAKMMIWLQAISKKISEENAKSSTS